MQPNIELRQKSGIPKTIVRSGKKFKGSNFSFRNAAGYRRRIWRRQRSASGLYNSGQEFDIMAEDSGNVVRLVASIVAAYITKNSLPQSELANLISEVHTVMSKLDGTPEERAKAEPQRPAVPIKKSFTSDYVICLEDGKKFKSLKRHLRVRYNMTPEQYRAKWGLATDYPIVAPGYAEIRSQMAKNMGLGQRRRGKGRKKAS